VAHIWVIARMWMMRYTLICSVLQCVAACCSVLQCVAWHIYGTYMSDSTHVNAECHLCSETRGTCIKASWHKYEWWRVWMSHVTYVNEACHIWGTHSRAVCCSVLQYVAVQCVQLRHTWKSQVTYVNEACHIWGTHSRAVCCSVLQCVAVCCSVLQCVAVCCSVLQCVKWWHTSMSHVTYVNEACHIWGTHSRAVCCSVLQCVAVCCSVLSVC